MMGVSNKKWMIFFLISSLASLANHSSLTPFKQMVHIPGGNPLLGVENGDLEEERLLQQQAISSFLITSTEVTNAEFTAFVKASNYQTNAEKIGWGWVWKSRWQQVKGADWRHPQGTESHILEKAHHPVVQVSWYDARAYCQWHHWRLPTELEWEYAARGNKGLLYPWGNAPPRFGGLQRANYGTDQCCAPDAQDGYRTTSPVGTYPDGASPFGILDMAGNVWEWVWDEHPLHLGYKIIRGGGWGNNPYCLKTTYRHINLPTASLDMVGFRCVTSNGATSSD